MKNPILLSSHLGDIPQASSSTSQFSGSKRKFGSPKKKKKNEYEQSFLDQDAGRAGLQQQEHPFMSRVPPEIKSDLLQPRKKLHEQGHYEDPFVQRWRSGSVFHGDRVAFGSGHEDDVDAMACCSSSPMTSLGQFGVWYPEDSVVKKPRNLMMVPSVEDLEDMYKLPKRRQRVREDGPVGALLFDIADPFANAAMKYDHFPDHVECATQHEGGSSKEGVVEHAKAGGAAPQSTTSFFETDEGLTFSDLQTGDDAIGYFKELESGGPVQLVYCNRTSSGKEFTPYDLSVVPRSLVDPEHFIISPAGMVHIEPGPGTGVEGTAISLEEWMHEKTIFISLRRIKFFGKYLIQKAFTIWRKHVGRRNFKRVRETLMLKLFKGKPAFLNALLQIHGYVCDLMDLKMLLFASNRLYTMDEFLDAQSQQRHHVASPAVEACSEKVQQVLGKICQDVKKQAQIFRESVRDEHELDDVIGVNLHQPRGSKVQGMVSIRNEKIERAKTYRRVMAEEKMLGKFIRLVDYMFVESLLNRSIMSLEEFLNFLEATRSGLEKGSKGVFITAVSFSEAQIVFTPDEDAIIACHRGSACGFKIFTKFSAAYHHQNP